MAGKLEPVACSVPDVTEVVPKYELLPAKTKVPAPLIVSPLLPVILPLKVNIVLTAGWIVAFVFTEIERALVMLAVVARIPPPNVIVPLSSPKNFVLRVPLLIIIAPVYGAVSVPVKDNVPDPFLVKELLPPVIVPLKVKVVLVTGEIIAPALKVTVPLVLIELLVISVPPPKVMAPAALPKELVLRVPELIIVPPL